LKYPNKKIPQLSLQFVLSCNFLNEGCEGGWPILNGYFAEEGYLVDENCAPYMSSTRKEITQCKNY
jgi:hypothetical protein